MASPFPFGIQIHNNAKGIIQYYKKDSTTTSDDKNQWQCMVSNLEPGDMVEVVVVFGLRFIVKKTTIYLVYDQSIDKEMEGLSTSNKDVVVSIDTIGAYKNPTMINPKRVHLDDNSEEDVVPLK